jgi:MFS family permease
MACERASGLNSFQHLASFQRNARLLILAVFLDGMGFAFVSLFFNFFILARGYSLGFLGVVNAMPAVTVLALGLTLGKLADRIGYRTSMILGIAVSYSAYGVVLVASSPVVVLAAMAVQGAGSILYYLSVNPFLMKHSGNAERPLLFSANVGLQILAGAGGNLIAGLLPGWLETAWKIIPGSADSYRIVLLLGLICGLLALVPLFLLKTEPVPQKPVQTGEKPSTKWTAAEKTRVFRMCLPNLMIGFGAALLLPYLNLFFRQRFSTSDSMLGILFSLSAVFTGLATLLSPRVAERLRSKIRAVAVTQTGSILFLLILGFAPWFPVAAGGFFLRAVLMNMSVPLYSAFCMENSPENKRGAFSSLTQMAWQAGWVAGPVISGFVQIRWGFSPLFIATSIFYAAAIIIARRYLIPFESNSNRV